MTTPEPLENALVGRMGKLLRDRANIDLRVLFDGVSPGEDRVVADAIRAYGEVVHEQRTRVEMEEIRAAVPWLLDAEEALDAAIEVCLESAVSMGESVDAAALTMIRAHPGVAAAIRRAVLLRASLVPRDKDSMPPGAAVFRLPHDFGRFELDGRCRYELRGLVGVGGQGVVYSAIDRLFSEPTAPAYVAVKVFHLLGTATPADEGRGEAIRAARIAHRGVVRAVDHGIDRGRYSYAAFELVEGLALDRWVEQREQFDIRTGVGIVLKIAEAVEAAHAYGVVHRDLKPSNILMDREGTPRVTDFGIARSTGLPLDSAGRYTSRGSLAFMSPEHFAGQPESDAPTSDVYGLAGLLYWVLTGTLPNGQDIASAMRRLEHDGSPPRPYPARVPGDLRLVCERGLSFAPGHRHRSAGAFASDLRNWLDGRPLDWTSPSAATRARFFVRRHRAGVACLALSVVTLAGAGAWAAAASERADARVAIQHERMEQERLASQLELAQERVASQHDKITQANTMIRAWKNAILLVDDMEPGRYIALLTMLATSDLVEQGLKSDLLLESLDVSVHTADKFVDNQSGSLEATLWQLIAGVNLINAGRAGEGHDYLKRAESGLATYLPADDPLLIQLRDRLKRLTSAELQVGEAPGL